MSEGVLRFSCCDIQRQVLLASRNIKKQISSQQPMVGEEANDQNAGWPLFGQKNC